MPPKSDAGLDITLVEDDDMTIDVVENSAGAPAKEADLADEAKFSSFWNLDTVIIKVQSTLFNVPRHALDVPGSTFADMFLMPAGDGNNPEGRSQSNPIVLDSSYSAQDFDAFLRMVLSPIMNQVSSYDEYLGVLRLAHKWNYDGVRAKAIEALTPLLAGKEHAATKVQLGKQFHVRDWVLQGLIDIADNLEFRLHELGKAPYRFDKSSVSKIFYIQKEILREENLKLKRVCQECRATAVVPRRDNTICHACQRIQRYTTTEERVETVFKTELAAHSY